MKQMHIQLAAGRFGSIRASGRRGRDHGLLSATLRHSTGENARRKAVIQGTR
jgi:hypothetical protein